MLDILIVEDNKEIGTLSKDMKICKKLLNQQALRVKEKANILTKIAINTCYWLIYWL